MNIPLMTEIIQLDDGRTLTFNESECQFYLAEQKITTETATRYWIDQGIAEPFKKLLNPLIDGLVKLVDSDKAA